MEPLYLVALDSKYKFIGNVSVLQDSYFQTYDIYKSSTEILAFYDSSSGACYKYRKEHMKIESDIIQAMKLLFKELNIEAFS